MGLLAVELGAVSPFTREMPMNTKAVCWRTAHREPLVVILEDREPSLSRTELRSSHTRAGYTWTAETCSLLNQWL